MSAPHDGGVRWQLPWVLGCSAVPRQRSGLEAAVTSHSPYGDILLPVRRQGEESGCRSPCLQVGNAYVIVYSVADRGSFESASELRVRLRRARQAEDVPVILVGNKSDLVRCREVSVEGERWERRGGSGCWGPPGGLCAGDPSPAPSPPHLSRTCDSGGVPAGPCPLPALPLQRAEPAPCSSTASSSRRRRLCSTTWPSSSRGWCGRSASAAAAKSPTRAPRPARSARRASPREPGASSTGWWPATAAQWPSKPAPSPATTCPCSESHHLCRSARAGWGSPGCWQFRRELGTRSCRHRC